MQCEICGGLVIWKGPLVNLTHTECQRCGAMNSQLPDDEDEDHDSGEDTYGLGGNQPHNEDMK